MTEKIMHFATPDWRGTCSNAAVLKFRWLPELITL